jgi:hypothetical protein
MITCPLEKIHGAFSTISLIFEGGARTEPMRTAGGLLPSKHRYPVSEHICGFDIDHVWSIVKHLCGKAVEDGG